MIFEIIGVCAFLEDILVLQSSFQVFVIQMSPVPALGILQQCLLQIKAACFLFCLTFPAPNSVLTVNRCLVSERILIKTVAGLIFIGCSKITFTLGIYLFGAS